MLIEGIRDGCFSLVFVRGAIVLLPKAGDLKLLNNRHPITLLNTMFKFFLKHYQLLAEVFIDFISPFQSAFISGKIIHHALLLTIEAIHREKLATKSFIFMKLDIQKAFNSLEWEFLFPILQGFNFDPRFIG